MVDPTSSQIFNYDYHQFVLQDPNIRVVDIHHPPKPFDIKKPEKTDKSKKDLKKQKDQKEKEQKQ